VKDEVTHLNEGVCS